MKNNQVYLDPTNIEKSMQELRHFYNLDEATMNMLQKIVERYPRPVIMYVDFANAPLYAHSFLDDLFTFNTQTGELVLFSDDPMTFVDGMIEMWMYINGFDTLMGDDNYWKVEFAIGSWKPIRRRIKRKLGIPDVQRPPTIVGLPPDPEDAPLEDPYPFKTLVSQLDLISFTQMIRLAGRDGLHVHFPPGTDARVIEAYRFAHKLIREAAIGLGIDDAKEFNRRLQEKISQVEEKFKPAELPMPKNWQSMKDDMEAASGSDSTSSDKKDDDKKDDNVGLMLGPSDDEPEVGRLAWQPDDDDKEAVKKGAEPDMDDDSRLASGPFGAFIEQLFDDEN